MQEEQVMNFHRPVKTLCTLLFFFLRVLRQLLTSFCFFDGSGLVADAVGIFLSSALRIIHRYAIVKVLP